MAKNNRIAILTGGGDCPGINAVIRAVAKKAILEHGMEVIGVEDGYDGLVRGKCRKLEYNDVSGILTQGGTILGTSNAGNPIIIRSRKATGWSSRTCRAWPSRTPSSSASTAWSASAGTAR